MAEPLLLVDNLEVHWASFGAPSDRASKQRSRPIACEGAGCQRRRVGPGRLIDICWDVWGASEYPVGIGWRWLPDGVAEQDVCAHVQEVLRGAERSRKSRA